MTRRPVTWSTLVACYLAHKASRHPPAPTCHTCRAYGAAILATARH